MATYAIGDVHGCYDQLQLLLAKIDFDARHDILWFTGDLVNGGPKSLETLRFIQSLGDKCICVLGNHDLVLLGVAAGVLDNVNNRAIGFDDVLAAPDREELMHWLRHRPLVHYDPKFNVILVHAGILPQWNLAQTLKLAAELETTLRSSQRNDFYREMLQDEPSVWNDTLSGLPRLRFISNTFTRMRFCDQDQHIEFKSKGSLDSAPVGFMPWFRYPERATATHKIIFGHWASLCGVTEVENALCIDTGCVWGEKLTALRLDDWRYFVVDNC